MGGSGIIGDVVYSLAYGSLSVPVTVVKDFRLPRWVGRDSLVCVVSYSGDTLESISTAVEALNSGAETCVVTSGGRLLELARSRELAYVAVDPGLAPRAAFPLLLIATLKALWAYGVEVAADVAGSLDALRYTPSTDGISRELASFILNSLPVIISDSRYYPVALRFKNELNENSKVMAKVEVVPEWGHNDIVGWGSPPGIARAVLLDDGDPLMGFVYSYLRDIGVPTYVLRLAGNTALSRILYGVYVAGLASIYLAEMRGVDASATKPIERYKEFLGGVYGSPELRAPLG